MTNRGEARAATLARKLQAKKEMKQLKKDQDNSLQSTMELAMAEVLKTGEAYIKLTVTGAELVDLEELKQKMGWG